MILHLIELNNFLLVFSYSALYRFIGEAQVAFDNYQDPSFIPAHIIIFDCDSFGVLFLSIRSFSLFHRVKENLGAVDYKDVTTTYVMSLSSNNCTIKALKSLTLSVNKKVFVA